MNNLPKPGEVWGVPDESLSWMRCCSVNATHQRCLFDNFNCGSESLTNQEVEDWIAAGAVNITAIVAAATTNAE